MGFVGSVVRNNSRGLRAENVPRSGTYEVLSRLAPVTCPIRNVNVNRSPTWGAPSIAC
jgi:hypothetical protein